MMINEREREKEKRAGNCERTTKKQIEKKKQYQHQGKQEIKKSYTSYIMQKKLKLLTSYLIGESHQSQIEKERRGKPNKLGNNN